MLQDYYKIKYILAKYLQSILIINTPVISILF